jgi:D-lactate dehydrogenase (cytochrome)
MLTKSEPDEIQSFLSDASNMPGGNARCVLFPETTEEVAAALANASRKRTPMTVSGGGTGVVGGRVPFGGSVLSTDRLNRIGCIIREEGGGRATAGAGVVLADFERAVSERGLFYPPDPTERSCYLGGTVATNASGARTFKYGATRNYILRLKVALATGDIVDLSRGQYRAHADGYLRIPLAGGRMLRAPIPTYSMARTRKNASGYFAEPGMDAVDLFVGSEGTLGVVTEVETALLPRPENVLCGIVFFDREDDLLAFVGDVRALSFQTRRKGDSSGLDASALEYFDRESLTLLRQSYPRIPQSSEAALFFEQETNQEIEDSEMSLWLEMLERHRARLADSWFATNQRDRQEMREFRHRLPVFVNEWLARHGQRKVSTDMAVPDGEFAGMLSFYKETLRPAGLRYVIFGHIGDNHVHVNIMPENESQTQTARDVYGRFVRRAVSVGGAVSAEHGIGKIKREYLRLMYSEHHLLEMAALKRAFDPACILGRGNIFSEDYL